MVPRHDLRAHQPDELFEAVQARFDPERPYPLLRADLASISRFDVEDGRRARDREYQRRHRAKVRGAYQRRGVRANSSGEQA